MIENSASNIVQQGTWQLMILQWNPNIIPSYNVQCRLCTSLKPFILCYVETHVVLDEYRLWQCHCIFCTHVGKVVRIEDIECEVWAEVLKAFWKFEIWSTFIKKLKDEFTTSGNLKSILQWRICRWWWVKYVNGSFQDFSLKQKVCSNTTFVINFMLLVASNTLKTGNFWFHQSW